MVLLRSLSGVLVLALATACGGGSGGSSSAPPIEVTTLAAAGPGSLSEAVATAPPGATITFAPGVTGTIGLGGGGLIIGKPLAIQGPAGGGITLSGAGTARVMEVTPAGSATLSDLEIADGGGGDGAGILNAGTITLTRVEIRGCDTGGSSRGGGINNVGATATLTDCTIEGCSGFNGGGFANDGGVMTLRRCLVTGNATSGNSGGGGLNSDGTLVLVNCTFHDNQTTGANRDGGGLAIFVDSIGAQTTVLGCTFTNNVATGGGGGIYSDGDAGPPARLSVLRIEGSIITGNTSGSGGPDCEFTTPGITFGTVRTNVIGIDLGSMIVNGVDGNQVGTVGVPIDPMLGALQDNGGPTLTRLPAAGSVARNAVPTIECVDEDGSSLDVDQRGFLRPVGGACDAGAVESP